MKFKDALKTHYTELPVLIRLKPIMFVAMSFSLLYGLVMVIISTVQLSFYIGITGSYSLILGISKYYALRKYKLVGEINDKAAVKEIENRSVFNITICAASVSFLHFSFAIVSTFFYDEDPANYSLWIIFFIAGSAFVKIVLNTVQALRTRKNHSIIIHHIKLFDAANALIALALTQRAILYFVGEASAKAASGVGGIFFSLCAGLICLSMFAGHKKRKPQ